MTSVPDIPKLLNHLPVAGGLAVPYAGLTLPDGRHIFGKLDIDKHNRALSERLCGVCGRPLTGTFAFFLRARDHAVLEPGAPGYVAAVMFDPGHCGPALVAVSYEAAVHRRPCAGYTEKSCPMVNGTMTHYRKSPLKVDPSMKRAADEDTTRYGQQAEPWFVAEVRSYKYRPPSGDRLASALIGPVFQSLRPVTALDHPGGAA